LIKECVVFLFLLRAVENIPLGKTKLKGLVWVRSPFGEFRFFRAVGD